MHYLWISVLISMIWSCKQKSFEQSEVQANIMVGRDYLWPNATADVCWEKNLTQQDWDRFAGIRQKVAETVTKEYARAGFTFKGWGVCAPGSRGIRVESWLESMGKAPLGMVKAFGARLDGLTGGLGFSVEMPKKYKEKVCINEEICVIGTAVHEFGHAVALLHEMNRAGSPCPEDQTAGWGGGPDNVATPAYDPDSIMNYCSLRTGQQIGRLPELSPMDVNVIKELYSQRPTLPAEEACQKDGFSWVAGGDQACCRTGSSKQRSSVFYNICPQNLNTDFDSKVPTTDQPSRAVDRFLTESKVRITAELPWQAKLATFACWSGEAKGTPEKNGFLFTLSQPADPSLTRFFCSNATFYNSTAVSTSTEAVMFVQPFTVPLQNETSFNLKSAEGIRVPVTQGKLQLTPALQQKLSAAESQLNPTLGSQSNTPNIIEQVIKITNLVGKVAVFQSTLVCTSDGKTMPITSGASMSKYTPPTKTNQVSALIYNFASLKGQALCTQLKLTFKRMTDGKTLETTLTLRNPLVVSETQPPIVFEFAAPACVLQFAK